MLDEVTEYISRGWAVFPCKNKIPLTAHGYKDASSNPEEVKRLFNGHPNANVAIATGRVSRVFVLDVDVKNGAGGEESLQELERERGALPHTVEALTWSGGRHLFFRCPQGGMGCKTGVRPGLDIRGDGGYVIAPPSVIEGRPYAWEVSHHPDDTVIAEAPTWLLEMLEEKQAAVDLSSEEAVITQNRNDALMHMGVKLRKMGLGSHEIEANLGVINHSRCKPPLSQKEVSKIARSVSRYSASEQKARDPLTDVWNADLFIEKYGDEVRFCDALGGWFIWDGTRWRSDQTFQILRLAKNTVGQMYEMAKVHNDKALFKHAVRSESEARLKAMVSLARSEGVSLESDVFDRDSFLLNCKNGTLDVRTGKLKVHRRGDYITRRVELNHRPDAACPVWEKFLRDIFLDDEAVIGFMQKAVGYALSGSMKEQCVFILYGVGMNGKSTFLKHIYRILGGYALNTPASTLTEKYGDAIPNDVARLKGTRFVTAFESGKYKALAEAQIKQFTGDDPISARFLHKEFFDFFATFKIFFATNHKPNISGTDKGIWRRIMTVPFEKIISPEERDPHLDEKLAAEYEGILAWAVRGFARWQKEGLGEVAKITEATQSYQEESDVVGNFIEEQCEVGPLCQVSASAILKAVQAWAKDSGLRSVKRNELIDSLKKRGFTRNRLTGTSEKGKIYWFGIGLKESGESEVSIPAYSEYDGNGLPDKRPF